MCDQSLQRTRQQQDTIHTRQAEEESVRSRTVLQDNLTGAALQEAALAQRMAGHLPTVADALYGADVSDSLLVTQEQLEGMSKREKNLLKERQEEARRLKEQEQERRRQEEERRKQEELRLIRERNEAEAERLRLQRKRIILEDDEVRGLLEQMIREQNSTSAMVTAETFLRKAAEKLISTEPLLAEYCEGSVDYVEELMPPFRMLIYSQVDDIEAADALFRETLAHEECFTALSRERGIYNIISGLLSTILEEEFEAEPRLAQKLDEMGSLLDERNNGQAEAWGDFELTVAKKINMPIEEGKTSVNVFGSGSPYKYLTKEKTRKDFEKKIAKLMEKSPNLTREAAQKQVAIEHQEELREKAMTRTLESSVVSGITREDWERHGGASFHHTLPAAQAYEVVGQSNGFLYAKPCGDGLCELRPTLPETVNIEGETIPLRRTYTLMIKAFMYGVLDEKGELKKDAEKFVDDIEYYFYIGTHEDLELRKNSIRPALMEILGDESQVEKVLDDWFKLQNKSAHNSIFESGEILSALTRAVGDLKKASEENSFGRKANTLLKTVVKDRRDEPLTDEQEKRIEAILAIYEDIDRAFAEMQRIRDMDPDSQEVPLPNACSAHGVFITNIRKNLVGEGEKGDNEKLTYRTREHVKADPGTHIKYIISHFSDLKEEGIVVDSDKEYFEGLQNALGKRELNLAELQRIQNITVSGDKAPSKYEYHVAANNGKLKDGARMTTEGFAAETKQYIVSPFSMSHAVGIYRGTEEKGDNINTIDYVNIGMESYYNHDNPLPTEDEQLRAKLKISLGTTGKAFWE
ncbi:MAG: hypothetical protein Q4C65_06915 [Eubacteriales bacterium]|nr:hypothetical protein [Eubacteriales bacterium]